jgi:hypothetical protein
MEKQVECPHGETLRLRCDDEAWLVSAMDGLMAMQCLAAGHPGADDHPDVKAGLVDESMFLFNRKAIA